jgi:uncharacterized membrane protein SpoIIM required for sporulation
VKSKIVSTIPALCFLVGFLICALLLPSGGQIGAGGDIYDSEIRNISFWDIYLNNSFMCLIFILGCGIGSSVLLLIQGLSFGGTFAVWMLMGNSAKIFWLLFLPHVIFEFIAMALAGHLGFRLLSFLLNRSGQTLKDLIRQNRIALIATFASVLVAALVECFLTPALYMTFA